MDLIRKWVKGRGGLKMAKNWILIRRKTLGLFTGRGDEAGRTRVGVSMRILGWNDIGCWSGKVLLWG